MIKNLVLLLTAVAVTAFGSPNEPSWNGPDQPVDMVTKNHYAEGFTPDGDTARFTDLIMIEIYPGRGNPPGRPASYPVGQVRKIYSQGVQIGAVKIGKVVPLQCDSETAVVSPVSRLKWGDDFMALSSNATNISTHPRGDRDMTAVESAEIRKFVASEFSKKGITGLTANKVKVDKALITRVVKDGPPVVIGSFSYRSVSTEYALSMVASLEKTGPIVQLSQYDVMKDLEDGTDYSGFRFVDQLDLDGDGVDELIFEVTGYEDEAFEIYKRVGKSWVAVWQGGHGGC